MLKFLFGNYAYTQLQLDLMLAGVAIVGIAGVYWLRAAEAMYPFLPLKHRLLLVGILEALAGVVILSGIYLLTD